MARHKAIHRSDSTKAALVAEAKRYGARVLDIDGAIDCVLLYRNRVLLVDWKSTRTPLTPTQSRLVELGWPIAFVADSQQLRSLLFPGDSTHARTPA